MALQEFICGVQSEKQLCGDMVQRKCEGFCCNISKTRDDCVTFWVSISDWIQLCVIKYSNNSSLIKIQGSSFPVWQEITGSSDLMWCLQDFTRILPKLLLAGLFHHEVLISCSQVGLCFSHHVLVPGGKKGTDRGQKGKSRQICVAQQWSELSCGHPYF